MLPFSWMVRRSNKYIVKENSKINFQYQETLVKACLCCTQNQKVNVIEQGHHGDKDRWFIKESEFSNLSVQQTRQQGSFKTDMD